MALAKRSPCERWEACVHLVVQTGQLSIRDLFLVQWIADFDGTNPGLILSCCGPVNNFSSKITALLNDLVRLQFQLCANCSHCCLLLV